VNVPRRNVWSGGALLVVLMAVTLIPFASLFTTALHPSGTYPSGLDWPAHPHWHNFIEAFHAANMGVIFKSSVLIVLAVVPVSVVIAAMAGFALGHLRIRGGQLLFVLFLLGLTLPFEGVIVPIYYEIRGMGLLNTRWAIILPLIGLFMPFAVYWMRAHFLNMPSDLSEAARVDGASTWQLFLRIHVPLARPAVASLAILLTVWTWNQFLLAIVLVDDPTKRTMAGALGAFQGQWGADIPLLSAGSLLILTPTLIVFLVFQRHFVAALLQGSLKG
jgi:raffinose/stachyose/melibiose transport system permease protein